MFAVFLDESGSPYKDYTSFHDSYDSRIAAGGPAPPYPFFVLAAIGVQECHLAMVDEWFGATKARFFNVSDALLLHECEIKGEVLYALRLGNSPMSWYPRPKASRTQLDRIARQKAVWQQLSAQQLEELERSVFDLMRRLVPTLWTVVVKQAHVFRRHTTRTWPPYYWALTYLQQRVVHHVQALHGSYQKAMFVMDETSTLGTAAQFEDYLTTRDAINATAAWPAAFGRYLVEVPLFGRSHLHQVLQLADLVAHTVGRHLRGNDALQWFDKIEPFLARHWTTGQCKDAGMTFIQ